jgi:hypothetical protein
MKADSKVINLGIYEIVDIKTTQDYLFAAYSSGAVNMHNLGDKSFNFVMQIQ